MEINNQLNQLDQLIHDQFNQFNQLDQLIHDQFNQLNHVYSHRNFLFCLLTYLIPDVCQKSRKHADGSECEPGWFIASVPLGFGEDKDLISYHLPDSCWDLINAVEVEKISEYDGHTSEDVLSTIHNKIISLKEYSIKYYFIRYKFSDKKNGNGNK